MAITIAPYTWDRMEAVRQFNRRIAACPGFEQFRFPEREIPGPEPGQSVRREGFLAVEDGAVRGGYLLQYQDFSFAGAIRTIAHYQLPISEGIANRAYAGVGVTLLRNALARQPLLFALGMGGFDRPLPKLLQAMGWKLRAVPFYFRVLRPARFLREIRPLRGSAWRRLLLDAAAATGAGWVAIRAMQAARKTRSSAPRAKVEEMPEFGAWCDEVWRRSAAGYAMIGARDRASLERLNGLRQGSERLVRLKVGNPAIGWALALDTQMRGDNYFGDLRVGTLADCLALPEDAPAVARAAVAWFEDRGVDLIISNQSHQAWGAALAGAGFLEGPSNYIFAASKELSRLLDPFEDTCRRIHITRGDGDGPIHL